MSIEGETPEDAYVMINDLNTLHEMNAGQLNFDPETGDETTKNYPPSYHTYNFRPRPTKRNSMCNMTPMGQQSNIAKPHVHVMLIHMSIKMA